MKLKMTNGRASAVLTGVLLLSLVGIARAVLVEGFESGFSASDSATGDQSIKTSYFGINAPEGTHHLLLTTINNAHDPGYTNQSGGSDAVAIGTINTFLGESSGSIRNGSQNGQEGSAFKIDLGTLTAGTQITLSYDFLTQEGGDPTHNDFAFWELNSGSVHVFADQNSVLVPTKGAGNPFSLETGYQTLTINITTTATYTLGIGVVDAVTTTNDNPSALLIDNIQINPVPEPTTVAFSIAGASLLMALRRRIKKTA